MEEMTSDIDLYPDRFLTCRILMHSWRESGMPWVEVKEETQVVYEKLQCNRCSNERIDQRTMQGRMIRRTYRYDGRYKLAEHLRDKSALAGERIARMMKSHQGALNLREQSTG